MAFPAVGNTATTNGSTASATPVVNLPVNIVSGNLLIVLFRTAIGTLGVGWPVGWTEIIESTADASDDAIAIAYRQADGTEGTTISLSTSSAKFAAIAYRITGAENPATQPPQVSAVATGTSATPDPASLSPTGGAKDYLWLWLGGWEGEQTSPPAGNPTNYATPLGANSGTAGVVATNVRVASAQRNLNAVSEDPGSWTISVSDDWTAWTLAVHPASIQTFPQTLTATTVASTSTRQLQVNKIATATAVASTSTRQLQVNKTATATVVASVATLLKEVTATLTAAIASSTATMTRGLTLSRVLTATIVAHVATMTRALTFGSTLSSTIVTSTSTRQLQVNKGLTTTAATSTSTIVKEVAKGLTSTVISNTATLVKSINKSLTASLVGTIATVASRLTLVRTLTSAVVTSSSTVLRGLSFGRTLSAVSAVTARLGKHRSFGLPFLFTAANWSTVSFFLEVFLRAGSGTVRARLYNETDGIIVSGSELSTASTSYVRLRSGALTLLDGKVYAVQFGSEDTDNGAFRGAKLVVV